MGQSEEIDLRERLRGMAVEAKQRSGRKVCIVGLASSPLRDDAYDDFEVWTLNDGWRHVRRYDRLYELHDLADRPWRLPGHAEHLEQNAKKVWRLLPGDHDANLYPLLDVLARYPVYHACSVSWMIAHALYEGDVTRLALERLHFASFHESILERACVEYWIGYARGLGVDVQVSRVSRLLSAPFLYGLQDTSPEHSRLYDYWMRNLPSARDWWERRFGSMLDYDYAEQIAQAQTDEDDAPA